MTPEEIELRLLVEAIYLRYHYDFRSYAMASLMRRVKTALARFGCASISQLQDAILRDGRTFADLLQYLTVQVSELFRDPPFWRLFRERIVPLLGTYPSFRIWVAGCSSGEEAWSYAIVLREAALLDRATIYATDINGVALEKAEQGSYAVDRLAAFTQAHAATGAPGTLDAHYRVQGGVATFDPSLRARMLFADHSLATDSVFAEMQVVSCRNVLIYFDRKLQDRALGLMAESLACRGFLGIGPKETLRFSAQVTSFESFEEETRWYRKR
jgi:chemotaxis protein methyltransferase CheR